MYAYRSIISPASTSTSASRMRTSVAADAAAKVQSYHLANNPHSTGVGMSVGADFSIGFSQDINDYVDDTSSIARVTATKAAIRAGHTTRSLAAMPSADTHTHP